MTAPLSQIRPVPRGEIGTDTPLRLSVAAELAYPDGSMSASGLRREADRGRLVIERTAGKDYTTLGAFSDTIANGLCNSLPNTLPASGSKRLRAAPVTPLQSP